MKANRHVGEGFAHAVLGSLHVTLLHGRATGDTARELVAVLERQPFEARRLSLFDASATEAIETEAFTVLTEHQNRRRDDLARVVIRQAIVTPSGMPGAIVTGYRAVFDFAYPVAYFAERGAALTYLERADAAAEIDELAALVAGDPTVRRLRALLESGATATLADAARRLAVSERSLQRHLRSAETSFSDELRAARIAIAKRLLVETDKKLAAIAVEAGCASLQSFSAVFRRATGETPSEFRERRRR
jgi:AraC-like DNA-binding protein